jgi:hypothetical protein
MQQHACHQPLPAPALPPQVQQYIKGRQRLGLPESARGDPVLEYVAGLEGLTRTQLSTLVDMCLDKYETKRVDPGGWMQGPGWGQAGSQHGCLMHDCPSAYGG